jgi:hypothetical protein
MDEFRSFFVDLLSAILHGEGTCLAPATPRQGSGGAIFSVLSAGDCDLEQETRCLFNVIGASLSCPCTSCRGFAFEILIFLGDYYGNDCIFKIIEGNRYR